jgi:hypothetical protein
MKFLKLAAIILSFGTVFMAFGYVNLQVSYKYEVDLMETNIKTDESLSSIERTKQLEVLKKKEKDIFFQRKIIKILFFVFLISLIFILYFLFVKK